MWNNNPVAALYNEALREWSHHEIACIVSIGTGKPETKSLGSRITEVLESCVAIALETEGTAKRFKDSHPGLRDKYFRFNVEQGLQSIGLEEWKYFDRMDAATQDYLNDVSIELDRCAKKLVSIPTTSYFE